MNKQQDILRYLMDGKSASLNEIYDNVPFGYYSNGHKHLGEILSRMVKSGKICRIKKGIFKSKITAEQGELFTPM